MMSISFFIEKTRKEWIDAKCYNQRSSERNSGKYRNGFHIVSHHSCNSKHCNKRNYTSQGWEDNTHSYFFYWINNCLKFCFPSSMHHREMARIVFYHNDGIIHENTKWKYKCKECYAIDIKSKYKCNNKYNSEYHRNTKCSIDSITSPKENNKYNEYNPNRNE